MEQFLIQLIYRHSILSITVQLMTLCTYIYNLLMLHELGRKMLSSHIFALISEIQAHSSVFL